MIHCILILMLSELFILCIIFKQFLWVKFYIIIKKLVFAIYFYSLVSNKRGDVYQFLEFSCP